MQRIVEPELMNDKAQAKAYANANANANADFEQSDQLVLDAFNNRFPYTEITGNILDLGCGPGNISFKFAGCFTNAKIIAVDGAAEMIQLAIEKRHSSNLQNQISFITGNIPTASIPSVNYEAIISNSLLHHLHQPEILWNTIKEYASENTKILIMDLFRPQNKEQALDIVNKYARNEPDILQQDFYNSLLAAFTPDEIKHQLKNAGLSKLNLEIVSDRHTLIFGTL